MKTMLFASLLALATPAIAENHQGKIELEGVIQAMPAQGHIGEWKVANKTVNVNAATVIKEEDGKAVVGKKVEVKGVVDEKGKITASKIETDN